jgi:hypothetical protein
MAEPSYFGEGTTPLPQDTRWRLMQKIVGAAYNSASSPITANKPSVKDTRHFLLRKLNGTLAGLPGG